MRPVPNATSEPDRSARRRLAISRDVLSALLSQVLSRERLMVHARRLADNPRLFAARVRNRLRLLAGGGSYDEWVRRFDTLTPEETARLRAQAAARHWPVKLSIIMPVYNAPETYLRRAVQSIRAQIYPNWELCIAEDCSTAPHVKPLLQQLAGEDARIKLACRRANGGISQASNSALGLATGDYVALVDQDDELPPHALLLVAEKIAADPEIDLIYSDEDKIDQKGRRFDAYFKPDWNPGLILSQNVFSHLGVYRRSLLARAGGFRSAFDGSQDYDLLLRCSELTDPGRIAHIPHVLYHWRAIPGSAATSPSAKPHATLAAQRALQEALDRRGINGSVAITPDKYYQVAYCLPPELPPVSIVLPSACTSDVVVRCLSKLIQVTSYPNFEVLLLVEESAHKDARRRAILERAARDERVKVLTYPDRPFNFSWVSNWGAAQAQGAVLCFLNDDTEVITPDWLERMVARLALDGVGAVGTMLYYANNTIQHAGVILGMGGIANYPHRLAPRATPGYFGRAALEQDFSCVTAACAAISRQAFESVGGFDERLAVAFNDVDLCIRLGAAGWRILWTPSIELYHHESATVGPSESEERRAQFKAEQKLMRERWGPVLAADKYYNPNLSLEASRDFRLAFPPRVDWRASLLARGEKRA